VVERLGSYQAQEYLRELVLQERAADREGRTRTMVTAPPRRSSVDVQAPEASGAAAAPPPAAEAADAERPRPPPPEIAPKPAVPPVKMVLNLRQRGTAIPTTLGGDGGHVDLSELALNILESLCSTGTRFRRRGAEDQARRPRPGLNLVTLARRVAPLCFQLADSDALVLIRAGLLETVNALLAGRRASLCKRGLRLAKHLLASDTSGEVALKVDRMCSRETIDLWEPMVARVGRQGDIDVLGMLVWVYQRLSHFPVFQKEAIGNAGFVTSLVQWLASHYPPASIACDALWEVLASIAERCTELRRVGSRRGGTGRSGGG